MEEQTDGTVLHIRNMVCNRCIMAVDKALRDLGLHPVSIVLGEASVRETIPQETLSMLRDSLSSLGFELIDDRRSQIIEQIKSEVIRLVHYDDTGLKVNLSEHLSRTVGRDYGSLSKLFSEVTGTTVEKYHIAQKIERAKELLAYGELSINEIADLLGYSSAAYLSAQFKSVTGLTPSHFRKAGASRRKPLDEV